MKTKDLMHRIPVGVKVCEDTAPPPPCCPKQVQRPPVYRETPYFLLRPESFLLRRQA